jgi:hypothetical protein
MSKTKAIVLIVLVTAASFLVTPLLWPMPVGGMQPTAGQLPFFILMAVIESLSFGIGVWFVIEGKKALAAASGVSKSLVNWTYLAICWSLLSWWPHDNLHKVNGENLQGLIFIEYGFHATLIIAATIIAYFFIKVLNARKQ